MKLSILGASLLFALASLSPTIACKSHERVNKNPATCAKVTTVVAVKYIINADSVENISETCTKAWKYLRRFRGSCPPSSPKCGGEDGNLEWSFWAPVGCNSGMVRSSWYEATRFKYGEFNC